MPTSTAKSISGPQT
ncbi:unnamed protein product [Gulo gulo]|uniref:Uncharacterized protein n=1 Tax=Gulo gulo TaxID=48420 RepID=A0A9X9LCD6_GULGU|nr:unnamed protein product [Gulo gulo]